MVALYVILPGIIEGFMGRLGRRSGGDGGNGGRRYESSAPHRLRRQGGEALADGLLRLGPLYVKIGQIMSCRKGLLPPGVDAWDGEAAGPRAHEIWEGGMGPGV